jgi:hypothetical protein
MPTQGTTKSTGFDTGTALLRATAAIAVILLVGCAHDRPRPPTDVPPALQAPAGQKLTRMLHATGVQIYQCKASAKAPSGYAWVYQEPKADLSDHSGKVIGRHYAGPTWEGDDGSKVIGEVVARTDAPRADAPRAAGPVAAAPGATAAPRAAAPAPNGIQWLLLKAKSNSGKGLFAKVQSIQRLHTIGGLAPPDTCDAAHADQRTRVPYSADYYFYNGHR